MADVETEVLIVGGSVGGCAAAMAAASMGCRVILTEETDWLGGQLTSQAVPPDEHRWIEQFGCTRRYRQFRDAVRQTMKQWYPLNGAALQNPRLNPGNGLVSRLCCEPRLALNVVRTMLAPARSTGHLEVRYHRTPVAAETDGDQVKNVTLMDNTTGSRETIRAAFVLDATELGDLLPLSGAEYVSGAESQQETGEMHAPAEPNPDNVQAITWCFPVAHDPGSHRVIERPEQWERWRDYVPQLSPPWPGRLLSWDMSHPITLGPRPSVFLPEEVTPGLFSLWLYRRIICRDHYARGEAPHEVTLVNWPQNDYLEANLIDQPVETVTTALYEAKQLSLSLLYWMQTEAPRADGGTGYPGLYLRPDLVGTADGLAKAPYIRESRRLRARFTVKEQHVGAEARAAAGGAGPGGARPEGPAAEAELFPDSVGVGSYRIDLHPSTGGDNYIDISSLPFQIPLGALIPVRLRNLVPACKNIGTTHITNGCYRLHPVEWNIGEAAGALAAFCFRRGLEPQQVYEQVAVREEFQSHLRDQGIETAWPRLHAV